MSKGKGTVAAVPFPFVSSSSNACCKNKLASLKHVFATAYGSLVKKTQVFPKTYGSAEFIVNGFAVLENTV